jgi:hypothetical protein
MRCILAIATLAAVAALAFGVLALRAPSGEASPFATGAASYGMQAALSRAPREASAGCPAVPPGLRAVLRLTACQTS